jgi:hypothetical protein
MRPRLLGVLLCYNDGDFLADAIEHLLDNDHDLIVWNHGSTDETASVLDRLRGDLREVTHIGRDVDFYDLYPLMSKHLLARYVHDYDWISWPDQDEILEGPDRTRSYAAFLEDAVSSSSNWIEFNDFVFWFTDGDDPAIASPCERIRHYSLARHGAPKVRSWRASATNIRWFNHNKAEGTRYPATFNLRHYPMRSAAQTERRLAVDRAGIQHGPVNYHYENMRANPGALQLAADALHYDDGRTELDATTKFDWKHIYGTSPNLPRDVADSFFLTTRRWEIAATVKKHLAKLASAGAAPLAGERLNRWLIALDGKVSGAMIVAVKRNDVKIVTEDLSREWTEHPECVDAVATPSTIRSLRATLDHIPLLVSVDANERSVRVGVERGSNTSAGPLPFIALVPCYGDEEMPRLHALDTGSAHFDRLRGTYYYIVCEPQDAGLT